MSGSPHLKVQVPEGDWLLICSSQCLPGPPPRHQCDGEDGGMDIRVEHEERGDVDEGSDADDMQRIFLQRLVHALHGIRVLPKLGC